MSSSYQIIYLETAKKHLEQIKKSGKKNVLKKIFSFVEEIETNPRIGLGHPKPLSNHSGDVWSRKINDKDRLVYEICRA